MTQVMLNATTGPLTDELYDTYNKILLVNKNDNNLVVCGGHSGTCQLRHLQDLSVLYEDNESPIYVTGATLEQSSFGFIGPSFHTDAALFVGTQYTGSEDSGSHIVSGRNLNGSPIFSLLERETSVTLINGYKEFFNVVHVYGFSYGGYSYFLTRQNSDGPERWDDYVSRIVRVCHKSSTDNYNTYTEVTLKCDGDTYNLAQAAYLAKPALHLSDSLDLTDTEQVLFVVFSKSETGSGPLPSDNSVICMYKMSEIETGFKAAVTQCLADTGSSSPHTMQILTGGNCGVSLGYNEAFECEAGGVYKYANNKAGVSVNAVEKYTGKLMTSISVTTIQDHTVCILGTNSGNITKVHVMLATSALTYEELEFGDNGAVHPDMLFDNTEEHFYRMTQNTVMKVKVQECSQYTTCEDYLASKDPYCGWCTLERRCSLYAECPQSHRTSRWLDSFSLDACINITSIEPEEGIPVDIVHQIELNMTELPDEFAKYEYLCNYDGYFNTTAVKNGQILLCDTPPLEKRPEIQGRKDHVTIQLYVTSTETTVDFVNTDFHFYKCSAHKS
ncbi:plexin-B-like [Glandiceps talaboti]